MFFAIVYIVYSYSKAICIFLCLYLFVYIVNIDSGLQLISGHLLYIGAWRDYLRWMLFVNKSFFFIYMLVGAGQTDKSGLKMYMTYPLVQGWSIKNVLGHPLYM